MFVCIVCGAKTHLCVFMHQFDEAIPICEGRCRRRFVRDPIAYLGVSSHDAIGPDAPKRLRLSR